MMVQAEELMGEQTMIEKPKKKKKRVKKPRDEEHIAEIPALTKEDIEIREDLSDNDRVFSDDQGKQRKVRGPKYDSDEGPNMQFTQAEYQSQGDGSDYFDEDGEEEDEFA
jgi:hypothetical protein